MPSSLLAVAPTIIALAGERAAELGRPIDVLDVGIGRGKYGLLLREYLGDRLARITGIEAEARYLDAGPWLPHVYDNIVTGDIVTLLDRHPDAANNYDLVLMVDVFEHLEAADAARILARMTPPVVICTPRDYFQNPEHVEYPTENHRSHWSAEDIAAIRPLDRYDIDAFTNFGAVIVRTAPLD